MLLRTAIVSGFWIGLMGFCLLAAAGNWLWPQGWAFIALYFFGSLGFGAYYAKRDPALLTSRLEPLNTRGTPVWDRIFLFTFIVIWFLWLGFMGLDAQRWHLSAPVPLAVNLIGAALIVAGFLATLAVFNANSFAAPTVRLQKDRGQHVIDTGPYALVRHPMYGSAIFYLFGMPLLLGSKWGLAVPPLFIIAVSLRAIAEENKLARELPGYEDYMRRVPYRLVPFVW
ncbi:MAG TPA: isoprenylcysteine carboxylmethyltransferase family protein [Rhizomicrobium sp.]|nr:isoprenylcysteine carboxylmethyltransferase family protein [Rhizomicrobium sp.]